VELALRLAGALWRFWDIRGYFAEGRGWLEGALAVGEQGSPAWRATALNGAGKLALRQASWERATALHEEALALRRALGDRSGTAASLRSLGHVANLQAEYGRAADLLEESLALYAESLVVSRDIGAREQAATGLEGLARVAAAQGQAGRAGRLCGAAEALREALGVPLPPDELTGQDRAVQAMRQALGEEAFAAAWAEGRALPLGEAVVLALAMDPRRPSRGRTRSGRRLPGVGLRWHLCSF
jgi:hypothetical protein